MGIINRVLKPVLKTAFVCPVCNLLLSDNIRERNSYNTFCSVCDTEGWTIKKCIMEKFVSKLKFSCAYNSSGCNMKGELDELLFHEASCNFMARQCPLAVDNCDWKGLFRDLKKHCWTNHADRCPVPSYGEMVTYLKEQNDDTISCVIFTCDTAFRCTWHYFDPYQAKFSVAHLGQYDPDNKFSFVVNIWSRGVSVASYRGFCYQPPLKPYYCRVPMYTLELNCDEEDLVFFEVRITKLPFVRRY